jgi:Tfp pilus assembly protein FimT
MAELIFIIIIVGILAAILIPSSQSNRLREAADQVVSHIRYTQHLAMMDDKFDPGNAAWFRSRWQILFEQNADNEWIYTIFSDGNNAGIINGNPEEVEIAVNPQDPSSRLTGRTETYSTGDINLGSKYGITDIAFTDCNSDRIVFDYLGRPMVNNPMGYAVSYEAGNLITDPCTITLTNSAGEFARITIQPETGFAQIN